MTVHADIVRMLPYVDALVTTSYRTVPRHIAEHDDLVQVGMLAVTEVAHRFDPDKGSFANFAYFRARGAIQDHLRAQSLGGRYHHHEFRVLHLDAPVTRGDTDTWADQLADPREMDDPILRDGIIRHATRGLNDRGTHAIRLVMLADLNNREAGDAVGVSESMVCKWLRKARVQVEPLLAA